MDHTDTHTDTHTEIIVESNTVTDISATMGHLTETDLRGAEPGSWTTAPPGLPVVATISLSCLSKWHCCPGPGRMAVYIVSLACAVH
jgi:hypothetical protein